MGSQTIPSYGFQHSKLPSATSIRLVRVLAGARNSILRCEMDIVDINCDLAYEAVSYVWGTSKSKISIHVSHVYGDLELEIPSNLGRALRHFRHPRSTRTLWVDSICINQSDIEERSQQVRLMGRIYRRASTVLIWLGEDVDEGNTEKACNCMNSLLRARPKLKDIRVNDFEGLPENNIKVNSFLGITRRSSDDLHYDLGIPLLGSPEFDALIDLLKNSWFSRAWTWQESFLAKERKFFCGSWSWSSQLMNEVSLMLYGLFSVCGNSQDLIDGYQSVLPMIAGLDFWTKTDEGPRHYLKLPALLTLTRHYLKLPALLTLRRGSSCTYPSDILYSLLGAAWETTDIEVDYKQPFELVFAKSTWQIMVQQGNLSILSQVEKDRHSSCLPTWVPDWRLRGENVKVSDLLQPAAQYAAAGSSIPVGSLSDDAKVLTISGLNWDRVSGVKSADSAELDDWVNSMFATTVDGINFYTPTNESLERALRRVYFLDKTEFTTECETTRWMPDSHENFEKIVERALSNEQKDRVRYGTLLYSIFKARKLRVILVTEGGRLGIASDNVLPGDVITMLLGGAVPVVLRPMKNKVGHYTFVAECYVHGFMDGEILIEARKSAQPEHDPADVTWLKNLDVEDVPFPVQEFHIH